MESKINTITESKKRLLDNFLSLGFLQVVTYVVPFLTFPYLSRVLGADKFGLVFFAQAVISYFLIVTDFGFGLSASREISINRDNKKIVNEVFSSVMAIKSALVLISFLIMTAVIFFIPKFRQDSLVYLYSFPMVIGNSLFPVWFFQGIERMKYITVLNIVSKMFFLVLIFVFVKSQSDYLLVPLLNSCGFIISGLIGFYIALKKFNVKLYLPDFKTLLKYFKDSSQFFLSRASVSISMNINTLFLGFISSNTIVGYYIAAEKIYRALKGLTFPAISSLYPYISKNKNVAFFKKIFYLGSLINLLLCTILFYFNQEIILLIFGPNLSQGASILKIFAITLVFNVPSILIGYPLIGAMGYSKEANNSIIIGSVLHVCGLIFLSYINQINITSIAIMILISELTIFLIRVFDVHKYKLWEVDFAKNKI